MLPNPLKHFLTLSIAFVFLLQSTLQAYSTLETTLNTGSTTLTAGESILLQSVTGKVDNLQLQSANVVLQSLNNVSHHETTETKNGLLTTTTTMQGSNVETVAGIVQNMFI